MQMRISNENGTKFTLTVVTAAFVPNDKNGVTSFEVKAKPDDGRAFTLEFEFAGKISTESDKFKTKINKLLEGK